MMMIDSKTNLFFFVAALLAANFYIRFCDPDPVDAQDLTALHLTQCIRAECGACSDYMDEKAAIAHVLHKRREMYNFKGDKFRTLDQQIIQYCSLFDTDSKYYKKKKRVDIRNSTFDNPLHGGQRWWSRMERWSKRFVENPYSVRDPHPTAWHWGGPADAKRMSKNKWRIIAKYKNWFWERRFEEQKSKKQVPDTERQLGR